MGKVCILTVLTYLAERYTNIEQHSFDFIYIHLFFYINCGHEMFIHSEIKDKQKYKNTTEKKKRTTMKVCFRYNLLQLICSYI